MQQLIIKLTHADSNIERLEIEKSLFFYNIFKYFCDNLKILMKFFFH